MPRFLNECCRFSACALGPENSSSTLNTFLLAALFTVLSMNLAPFVTGTLIILFHASVGNMSGGTISPLGVLLLIMKGLNLVLEGASAPGGGPSYEPCTVVVPWY